MSCTLSHECRVMLSSLLTASTDATRVWLRAEMDRTVDQMLHSIFNRLTTKLTNRLERTQSGVSGNSKSQLVPIKKELETMLIPGQVQTSSYAPVLYEQSNHYFTNQHWSNDHLNDHLHSSQLNCADGHLVSNDDQVMDENENEHDSPQQIKVEELDGESSSLFVKKPRMDTTQSSNAQAEVTKESTRQQSTDETQSNEDASQDEEGDRIGSEQSEAIDTGATIEHCDPSQHNSYESMVIQQGERDANNAIGEESIDNDCTTNPTQPNLAQPNLNLQCPHCRKLSRSRYDLNTHLRVHTGERPFQCDQCSKRFSDRSSLTRHQLIHQNIKRFRCDACGKEYVQKHNLDSHLRIHSGDRPFACRHCDRSFAASFTRNNHEQAIHLHVKPYRCKQCAHTATHRSTIIAHIRVFHFGLPKTIKQQRALNIIDDRDPKEFVEKV